MSVSVLQIVLFLVVLIGFPVLSVRIVRRGPADDLAWPLSFLHLGFWGAVFSFALAMGASTLFGASDATPSLSSSITMGFYAFACFYWTAIGVLAHRLQRSWVLWVVVGLATLAIGFLATYILMAIHARRELASKRNTLAAERSPVG